MDTKNLEQARKIAETGVTVMEDFRSALPWLAVIDEELAQMKAQMDALKEIRAAIADSAAQYAETHTTALDEPLTDVIDGTKNGSVTIDGKTYRLTVSRDNAKRASGDNITQAFLKKLPPEWTKSSLRLSNEAISEQSDAQLKKYGLYRPFKRVWNVA